MPPVRPVPLETSTGDDKHSRRIVILIAVISFAFASVWAYVFFQQKPRVADGTIQSITVVPLHSELRQGGTMSEGYGGGVEKSDQVLVWVAFSMTNLTLEIPLFETGQRATLSLPDGEQLFAAAASPAEVAKVRAYPMLQKAALPTGELVPGEMTLSPKKATQGLALFSFPVTKQVWDTRREFSIAVSFQYQRDLAIKEKTAQP